MAGAWGDSLRNMVSPLVPAEEQETTSSTSTGSFFGGNGEEEAPPAGPSWLTRARKATGLQKSKREEVIDTVCPSMSFKHRLIAFAVCFGIGGLIALSSMFAWVDLMKGKPTQFAIRYSLGDIISLCGTFFIVGPKRQLKMMTDPTRRITAAVYILAMAMTLVCALVIKNALLTLLAIIVQFLAMLWYILSFIPFARRMAASCMKSCMSMDDE